MKKQPGIEYVSPRRDRRAVTPGAKLDPSQTLCGRGVGARELGLTFGLNDKNKREGRMVARPTCVVHNRAVSAGLRSALRAE